MGKTYEQYRDEDYKTLTDSVNRQLGVRKQSDDTQIGQIHAAIDREAGAAREGYQNRINGAAEEFQPLYDRNALQEMISRKQVEESMANMGLTDSGLNRTQQTAIALQRGNADTATRKQQRDYVTKAQEAIDSIMASAASQKAQQEASIRKATDDWYVNAMANAEQSANSSASTRYQADQEYAAKIEAANIEARAKALEVQQKAASDNSAARAKYAQALITSGVSEDQAWASAYARYGTGDKKNDTYYSAYNRALNAGYSSGVAKAAATAEISGSNVENAIALAQAKELVGKTSYNGGLRSIITGATKGIDLYNNAKKQLAKDDNYKQASQSTRNYMIAIALGNSIRKCCDDAQLGSKHIETMLKSVAGGLTDAQYLAAAEAAGIYSGGTQRRTGAQR